VCYQWLETPAATSGTSLVAGLNRNDGESEISDRAAPEWPLLS